MLLRVWMGKASGIGFVVDCVAKVEVACLGAPQARPASFGEVTRALA